MFTYICGSAQKKAPVNFLTWTIYLLTKMRKNKNLLFFPHFMIYDTTEKIKSLVFFLIFDKIIFGRSALVGWTAVRVGKII